MAPILERDLVYVTGKGGVGRSTVCAALGLAGAALGRRTIVCEVAEQDRLSRAFGRPPRVGDEPGPLDDRLWGVSIDPQAALRGWLSNQLGSRTLSRLLFESDAFSYFAAAAPGAREIATLGRAAALAEGDAYDLVILDAPASGHGVAMLRTPSTFADIARVGPVRRQALALHRLLADRSRTAYVAVALPEEMPVNETLEIERALPRIVGGGLEAIVVNGVYPRRFDEAEVERAAAAARDGDSATRRALAAVAAEHRWARGQRSQLERLGGEVRAPVLTLPFLFEDELRAPQLERLAGELAGQLDKAHAG
ncbi:MAG TPA: ArsA-related P-loop ATPase [Solirubrobacteraceae bacterium]|jgi:anion-transporting  ArsA/GET3 family ATPase|nr:ArsA-related P-loop ATPase [Solirubrobacteraceae bacterium]